MFPFAQETHSQHSTDNKLCKKNCVTDRKLVTLARDEVNRSYRKSLCLVEYMLAVVMNRRDPAGEHRYNVTLSSTDMKYEKTDST